jgi:hypothetical protein
VVQSFVIFIPFGVGARTQFQTPARSQIFTLAVIGSDMAKYLTTFLLILSIQVFGQRKLDIDSFVMGIIDDGTKELIKEEMQDWEWIDEFAPCDFELMDCIDSLINIENLTRTNATEITSTRNTSPNNRISKMYYSKELAKRINRNYKFKFHHEWDLSMRKLYIGHIKPKCLKSNDERFSYLLGAWVCFGKIEEGRYSITIRRSQDKFKFILNSLKELGCEIDETEDEVQTDIDTNKSRIESQTVTFKPTSDLINEIKKFTGLVGRLEKKRFVFYSRSE